MSAMKNRNFYSYVIPSILAFALSGIYTIVDGFFIGNSLGDAGLTAITLGYPVCALIQAIGTGIGLSGAIRFTILAAQGETRKRQECFSGTVLLMAAVSLLLAALLFGLTKPILHLFGARGESHALAAEYVRVIALGAIFQLLATGFIPFIRNMGGASFAMAAMILGFVTNIVLDYIFVWVTGWGMAGAAWATIIGQGITMLAAAAFFAVRKCRLHFPAFSELLALWRVVLKVSISPFGLTFSPVVTLLLMNRFFLFYGSEQSVAVFGCIDYILSIIYLLLQGVGDGSQPMISRCYGEGNMPEVKRVRTLAYRAAFVLTAICMVMVFLARTKVGTLFGASAGAKLEVAWYLPLFLATLLFLCYSRITTSYLYATEKTVLSYVLVYAEPLCTLLLLLLLPVFFNLNGVWLAMPLAQVITFGIAVIAKRHADRTMGLINT